MLFALPPRGSDPELPGGVARRVLELLPAKWATGTAPAELPEDFFPPPMPLELEGEAAVRTCKPCLLGLNFQCY